MQKIRMDVRWEFSLTGAQARLVLAALGGRLREDQYDDAKRLGNELTLLRAKHAGQLADEMDLHADKVTM